LSFATTRTETGAQEQQVFYTVDPAQEMWIPIGESYLIIGNYIEHKFSLTGVTATYDHPDLAFKVTFSGISASNTSGNDRFDNIQIKGIPLEIIEEEFCEGDEFTYDSITYTQPGQYLHFTTAMDCGSHIMLRLQYPSIDTTITINYGVAMATEVADACQWLDCGQGMIAIPNATGQEFIPNSTGSYAVQITADGCSVNSGCHYLETPSGIMIYPNPVQDILHVEMMNSMAPANYEVFDGAGRLVTTGRIDRSRAALDVRMLVSGVYTLVLKGARIDRFRFIK
ncbi:MAG: T9SS type A sorting domain-containing protein, partial [Bacteroidota bacterium]|nr:T9SS type A sorting domain-containing protein [Bacteroidota bacterium]